VGYTTLKVALNKLVKREKTYYDNQRPFIPYMFYTFDFLVEVDLLNRIQMVIHNHIITLRSMHLCLKECHFLLIK
jgi:hypothetical protein